MLLYNQLKPVTVAELLSNFKSTVSKGLGFFGIGELNVGYLLVVDAQFNLREVGADWTIVLLEKNRLTDLVSISADGAAQGMMRLRLELNCLFTDENGTVRITGSIIYPKAGGGFESRALDYTDLDIDTLSEFAFDLKLTASDNDAQADCMGLTLQWAATGQQM